MPYSTPSINVSPPDSQPGSKFTGHHVGAPANDVEIGEVVLSPCFQQLVESTVRGDDEITNFLKQGKQNESCFEEIDLVYL